ncbi:MAG: 50S ribosomal protein L5 [Candidatus Micrarchaeia archaeon]
MNDKKNNPMKELRIEKVTINIGAGSAGEVLDNAKELVKRITGKTPIETRAKDRNPIFKLRKGLEIGTKVTLRGKDAEELLKKAFVAKKNKVSKNNFDNLGNLSFGIKEYIDFPGIKYDPVIGMMGFDVCVTINRRGKRVRTRRIKTSKIGKKHLVNKEDSMKFINEKFKVEISKGE